MIKFSLKLSFQRKHCPEMIKYCLKLSFQKVLRCEMIITLNILGPIAKNQQWKSVAEG